jgi:hypothetical protein
METLQDIVYVFSREITNVEYEAQARLHLIHVASEPSEKNVQFALKANATYSLETHINVSTLRHFRSCLAPTAIYRRVAVFTSPAVCVKSVLGPVRAATRGSPTIVDLRFFSRSIPPFLVLQSTTERVDCVSVQVILDVFDGHLFVLNRAWKRAAAAADWAAAVDCAWCVAPFIQLKAAETFKIMGLATPWAMSERKVKLRNEASMRRKRVEQIERVVALLMSSPDILTDQQRAYFALAGFYGGNRYYDDLYAALMTGEVEAPYLLIPPFLIFNEAGPEDIGQFNCGMAPIRLAQKKYARLRNALHEFKSEMTALDSPA